MNIIPTAEIEPPKVTVILSYRRSSRTHSQELTESQILQSLHLGQQSPGSIKEIMGIKNTQQRDSKRYRCLGFIWDPRNREKMRREEEEKGEEVNDKGEENEMGKGKRKKG